MGDTLFTLPGRLGDDVLRLSIAYQYSKQSGQPVDIALNDHWDNGLIPVLQREAWVNKVFTQPGIVSDGCGGQPWDFGVDWSSFDYEHVYHLGYRSFPFGNCLMTSALDQSGLEIDRTNLYTEPCLDYPVSPDITNLAIHVDASHGAHRREEIRDSIMQVWGTILPWFRKVYIICRSEAFYPELYDCFFTSDNVYLYEDGGDLSNVCSVLARSVLVGTDSAIWTLTRCLKSRVVCLLDPKQNAIIPAKQHPLEHIVDSKCPSAIVESVKELLSS